MTDYDHLSHAAQEAMARRHAAREQALPKSRAAIRLCANAIRAVHRGDFAQATALLAQTKDLLQAMRDDLQDDPDIYYAGFVEDAQKEYAEASITLALIQNDPLPLPDDLAVEWSAYLNGMGEAVGELRRHVLDLLRQNAIEECERFLAAMDEIFAVLTVLDFPDALTHNLRRTTDVARGLIEKTRGDLTSAVMQARLSAQLERLTTRNE
jgi:translin